MNYALDALAHMITQYFGSPFLTCGERMSIAITKLAEFVNKLSEGLGDI